MCSYVNFTQKREFTYVLSGLRAFLERLAFQLPCKQRFLSCMAFLQSSSQLFHITYFFICIGTLLRALYPSSERESKFLRRLFTSSIKREIISTLQSCSDDKEMYKKVGHTCEVVVLLTKPIAFFTFSLQSPLSDLKVPINERSAVKRSARDDGKVGRGESLLFPLSFSHHPLRTRCRNSLPRSFRDRLQIIRDDWGRVSSRVARIVSHGRGLF